MSTFVAKTIRGVIQTRILSAWPTVTAIYPGPPEEYPENTHALPMAFIITNSVEKVPSAIRSWRGRYSFTIIGRFAMPSSGVYQDAQEDRANELYAAMITGSQFGTIGDLHDITGVSYTLLSAREEKAYEVTIDFYCESEQSRV
jgi:hypothetical protein